MLKTRLLLLGACIVVILLLFQLPKAVVENESEVSSTNADTVSAHIESHAQTPRALKVRIQQFRHQFSESSGNEKNAIFADSLANLYQVANQFDSAAWFAEEAAKFFNTPDHWLNAGDNYYQAYTLALDQSKQTHFAVKAQEFYGRVLKDNPDNLTVKTKMAMTYLTSASPMQGITLLREVLAQDPKNELALFNMGMLSIQSGQYERAIERLDQLMSVNPNHIQGRLLLGIALMNSGNKARAREELEKVKQLDKDPAVQATVDSYLKDLK